MDNYDGSRFANLEIDFEEPAPPAPSAWNDQAVAQLVVEVLHFLLELCALPRPAIPSPGSFDVTRQTTTRPPAHAAPAPLVTSNDLATVEDRSESTGSIVYWSVSGHVSQEDLAVALEGIIGAPNVCSEEVALRRAVKALQEKSVFFRPHPRGGYAIIRERALAEELLFDVVGRVWIKDSSLCISPDISDVDAAAIRSAHDLARRDLSSQDLSSWLVRVMDEVNAVGLRPTGGVYFVPRAGVPLVQACRMALETLAPQCRVHEIPALRTAEVVRAVVEAAALEFVQTLDQVEAELNTVGEIGTRAATTRLERLAAAERKAGDYSRLSGQPVAASHTDRIAKLRERLRAATSRTALLEVG